MGPAVRDCGLIAALISQVIRDEDGLPLSTYPMCSGANSNLIEFVTDRVSTIQGTERR